MREAARIDFLVRRDGQAAAARWIRRTLGIYRRAVLDRRHFASKAEYRRSFVESYCEFKLWLTAMCAARDRNGLA